MTRPLIQIHDAATGEDITRELNDAEYAEWQARVDDPLAYQAQRAAEYPPMADYIDGIVKGDQEQVQAYIDACLAVKAKYPKP
jgi:hypothetical protein